MATSTRWALRGTQIRDDDGRGQHVATYMRSVEDGRLLAAAPELLELLLETCDEADRHAVDFVGEGRQPYFVARVRDRLRELRLTPPAELAALREEVAGDLRTLREGAPNRAACTCRSYFERTGEHAVGCALGEEKKL